jgi:hypothetical protein
MSSLAERLSKKKEAEAAANAEQSSSQKLAEELQGEVDEYMNLWRAAYFNRHANVAALLDDDGGGGGGGAKVDAVQPSSGCTALVLAAEQGNAGIVELLLDKGKAAINQRGQVGGLARSLLSIIPCRVVTLASANHSLLCLCCQTLSLLFPLLLRY